jgi:hypothetical protein
MQEEDMGAEKNKEDLNLIITTARTSNLTKTTLSQDEPLVKM